MLNCLCVERKMVNQAVMAVMTPWEDGVMDGVLDSLINVAAHSRIEIRSIWETMGNRVKHAIIMQLP